MSEISFRRVAAHEVIVCGERLSMCVVEISDGNVVNYYQFTDELPMTEWLGDRIDIERDTENRLIAFWNGKRLR